MGQELGVELEAEGPGPWQAGHRGLCAQAAALQEAADQGGEERREERGQGRGGAKRAAGLSGVAHRRQGRSHLGRRGRGVPRRPALGTLGGRLASVRDQPVPKAATVPTAPLSHSTATPDPASTHWTWGGALPPLEPGPAIRVTRAFPLGIGSRMFPPSRSKPGSQGRVSGLELQTQAPAPEPEAHTGHVTVAKSHRRGGRAEDRSCCFLLGETSTL